ncbi:flagellar basal body P-ring protein FlgI [Sphingomonas koreensis]|jgi:flagellar P-ring protein precursor FlgI|uniref:Flagellar P-ring protein n=1 Tax=Sphingomonas koreensis TaxID=93064 RepID=A0A1L6J9S7_9SPHN|nr:flagellar basal body P-ring protein FlgI [Sphingomonas koreensis]APR52596.1 flagellar biosynthesis protein FlgA [Sphingomonas koreensis]MDC7812932.1 flagellar basal body P-ring protein FlgI [Sphingomonas koreensis]PJI87857.1 flagellar P-ring protein precursor FlgI [Sphingomonas koreensis]RSU18259.1 flagellar basal body P-ring protein FlgI [Sphingomonas koreensis]RSU28583.1 flagellar basal body P-ring protein FlgI [Sphingomonas koreensis]
MKTFTRSPILTLAALLAALAPVPALARPGPRIKDIVDVQNVRPNQLVGYGLVVGLQGTGDRIRNIPFTEETLQAMLERMGVNVRGAQMLTQNVAAVSVTATMPPFARAGSTIDVQVSALGDATSLQGGTLLVSSLRALDGEIYAVAQGPVAVSGFKAQGAAARLSRGVTTTARIAGGAIIEREVPFVLKSATSLKLALKNPDFTTADRIAGTINRQIPGAAEVLDPATVEVRTPQSFAGSVIDLVTRIENMPVEVDQPARIVINEAAGTVVMGADVRISPVAIAQGGLTISVTETPVASQPGPFSRSGETVTLPRTQITANDGNGASLAMLNGGASLQSLVSGLNALGVSPRDLITILQALKGAGALQAEIAVQ